MRTSHSGISSRPQRGFSLIELMIAMLIGLAIGAALVQLFIASRVTYNVSDGLARAQESARYALEIMNRDIRMADSEAICGNRPVDIRNWVDEATVANLMNQNPVMGWEYDGTGVEGELALPATGETAANNWSNGIDGLPAVLTGPDARVQALPGSDVFAMFTLAPNQSGCSGCDQGASGEKFPNIPTCPIGQSTGACNANVQQGAAFLAVNCDLGLGDICINIPTGKASTLVCEGTVPDGHPGNWPPYNTETEFYDPSVIHYVVAESSASTAQRPRQALFRLINCGAGSSDLRCIVEELVDGVESLQIFYRVRNQPGLWTAANIPGNRWDLVDAVHLNLIMTSPEDADNRALAQTLLIEGDLEVTANDRRVRQVYSNVVAVRNRITVR